VAKHFLGDQVSARGHLERALTNYSAMDHRLDFVRFQSDLRVSTRIYLARVLSLLGFADQAMRSVEESIDKARITGDANLLCHALAIAACPLALSIGDLSAAARYAQMLRDHAQEYSLPLWGGYGAMYQSVVSIKQGDREATESSLSFSSLTTQIELVDALVQAGRISEGLAAVEAGLELSDGAWATPELQRLKGELLLLQNGTVNAEPAADLFGQALSGARAQEALSWELRAATSLARLLRNQGRPAEAIACLQPVYDRFTEGFDTADLRTAKAILDDLR
jgi:predicted ATPase